MDSATAKQELKKLIERHNLPELKSLSKEIEIVDIIVERKDLPENLLVVIRRRFTETIYSWINLLHSLVVPNPQSIIVNKDSEAFSEKEKESIYKIMATLARITRESTYFEADKTDEKAEAEFISTRFKEYMKLKPRLSELNKKIIEHWKKEEDSK